MRRSIKRLSVVILFMAIGFVRTHAQQYQIKVEEDDPDLVNDRFVTLDVLGVDLDLNFLSSNLYVGSTAFWPISDRLIAEGSVKIPYLTLSGEGLGFTLEPGVFFALSNQEQQKEVPLLVSGTLYAEETRDGDYVDTYTTVNARGTYLNRLGARGGLYVRKAGYENDVALPTESNATMAGIYLGLERVSQAFVRALLSGNGLNNSERIGAGLYRMYADVFFLPVRTIADEQLLDQSERNTPFGFRAGYQLNRRPFDTDRWITKVVYGGEIGSRPLTGFYITVNMSWVIFDK